MAEYLTEPKYTETRQQSKCHEKFSATSMHVYCDSSAIYSENIHNANGFKWFMKTILFSRY